MGPTFLHAESYHAGRDRTVVGCHCFGYICVWALYTNPSCIAVARWAVEPGCETHVFVDLRHKTNVTRALRISRYVYWGAAAAALLLSVRSLYLASYHRVFLSAFSHCNILLLALLQFILSNVTCMVDIAFGFVFLNT